jgi:hypothetical protein
MWLHSRLHRHRPPERGRDFPVGSMQQSHQFIMIRRPEAILPNGRLRVPEQAD